MSNFKDLIAKRRTTYHIGRNTDVTPEQVTEYLRDIIQWVPTASHSQTSRLVLVFGDKHQALWDEIHDVQSKVLSGDMWDMMSGVIAGAKEGLGTVLFFEDQEAVQGMPTSDATREAYSHHNNANHQYATWLGLTDLGLGASLQHFNIGYEQGHDKSIKELLYLPENYALVAEMPFGSIETPAEAKETIPNDVKVQVK
ncbi:nitroreductase family protein [Aerococcaceae bacterium DSM 111020]|nr:nitroreductase family protein [Aerococcaceae bacterium DSM 111020]